MSEIVSLDGRVVSTSDTPADDETIIAHLLTSVGVRVRNARSLKGISRRILSETSGVSQRYLAQLESGKGNISLALLLRIARALDIDIRLLVGGEDPLEAELIEVVQLYRNADRDQRARVLRALDPEHPDLRRAKRIALIGLRGAGKSTLGRLAAAELGTTFVELNDEIETASGMAVAELIALYGQEGYRHLERQALERLVATHHDLILAVAGGIVSEPETFGYLLRHYHTIWLKADPEEHMGRVRAQGDERPMAGNPDAMADLENILTSREQIYSRAEAVLSTSGMTIEQSLNDLVNVIDSGGFLED